MSLLRQHPLPDALGLSPLPHLTQLRSSEGCGDAFPQATLGRNQGVTPGSGDADEGHEWPVSPYCTHIDGDLAKRLYSWCIVRGYTSLRDTATVPVFCLRAEGGDDELYLSGFSYNPSELYVLRLARAGLSSRHLSPAHHLWEVRGTRVNALRLRIARGSGFDATIGKLSEMPRCIRALDEAHPDYYTGHLVWFLPVAMLGLRLEETDALFVRVLDHTEPVLDLPLPRSTRSTSPLCSFEASPTSPPCCTTLGRLGLFGRDRAPSPRQASCGILVDGLQLRDSDGLGPGERSAQTERRRR